MEVYKNIFNKLDIDWGDMTEKEIKEFVEKLNKALWRLQTGGSQ